jgi:gliding motility-associated-like protein
LPDVVLEPIYYLCLDEGSVTVEAADYYDTYGWFNDQDLILGNAHEHTFVTAGNYYLIATNADGCMKRTDFVVEISESPEITDIAVVDLSTDNTLTVTAVGAITGDPLAVSHFEYALDDGPYQTSNVFHNVHGGWRLLRVRDIHGCGEVTRGVMILDFPKFFTPNDDGFNDRWHLFGHEHVDGIEVYIYNRQGKLLKIIYQYDLGWDGQYNGNPIPATDYWFRLELRDGRTFRSHFSLIR